MEDKESKRKMVEANLRSVTQSCKGGVPIERLERDYRDLLGTSIPYRDLGFSTLEAMIRSMSDVVRVARSETGSLNVMGVADKTTAHIASLVSRQRPTKQRKAPMGKPRFRVPSSRGAHARVPFSNYRNKFQPAWSKPAPHQKRVERPTFTKPEPLKVERSQSITVTFPNVERPQASIQPLLRRERSQEITSPVAPKKVSPPLRTSSYEVPPRFARRHLQDMLPKNNTTTSSKRMNSVSSNAVNSRNFSAEDFNHVDTVINPPKAQLFVQFDESGDHIQKIPSPKPIAKERRKVLLPTPPLPSQLPPKEFVEEYAEANNLTIHYHTTRFGQKAKMYVSVLTLGDKKIRSFPEETYTPEEAEEMAAVKAVEYIKEEEANAKYTETTIETPEEIMKFVGRIEEIVSEKPRGIWSMGVSKEYESKFQESLPPDWLTILQQNLSSNIEVETPPERLAVPKEAFILRFVKNSGAGTPASISSTSSRTETINEEFVTKLHHGISNLDVHNLPLLMLPENDEWEVFVTYVSSAMNIAVRLIDQAENFEIMSEEMKAFYEEQYLPVKKAIPFQYYVTRLIAGSEENFFRIRANFINTETNKVRCDYIDIGDSGELNLADIQELHSQFQLLPPQAIQMSLYGLEDYVDLIKFEYLDEFVLGKTVIADIKIRNENSIASVLYDTSGAIDINLNEQLREKAIEESLNAALPEIGSTCMCYLTHATAAGEIYIRLSHPQQSLLEVEMEKLFPKFEEAPIITANSLSSEKMYVSKYSDGSWYRTLFCPSYETESDEVEMFYVDYGNSSLVPLTDVRELEPISKFFASLPLQAFPCLLSDVPPSNMYWTEKAVSKLYSLAPDNHEMIVKVDRDASDTSPPVVSLYKRNEDFAIVSINQTLSFSRDLFSPATMMNGAVSPLHFDRPLSLPVYSSVNENSDELSSRTYMGSAIASPSVLWAPTPDAGTDPVEVSDEFPPPAVIPEVGTLFDVYITFVASPSNFAVQPLKSADALTALLEDMRAFYHVEENLCEMHSCLLKLEHYYAALYKDGAWYRVKAKGIDAGEQVMVTVQFIDFGDFDTISLSNLQPLYRQFKVLPCQAIKASLYGVKPMYSDWLAEQCFEAKEIMNERQFVSRIEGKTRNDKQDFGEWTLNLVLIDTSLPDQDVFVHELLIEKGIACAAT